MRRIVLCVLVWAASARAEPPGLLSTPGRLFVTGGGAYRDHQQLTVDGTPFLRIGGSGRAIAPWNIHLSGAWFFNELLGANLEARGEIFYATQAGTTPVPQPSAELTPSVAARWLPRSWLSLEGQLGWAVQMRSTISAGPSWQGTVFMGPSLAVAASLAPSHLFSAQVFFRAQPLTFATSTIPGFAGRVFAGGFQLSLGALRIGGFQVGGAVTFEVSSTFLGANEGSATQLAARGGVGLSLMRAPPELVGERLEVKVSLAGTAVTEDGAKLPGVVVTIDGEQPTRTDEAGAFSFAGVSTGAHVLRARKAGYKPAQLEVEVTAQPTPVTVKLLSPTGPGRIRGVVRSAAGVLAGAAVTVGDARAVSDDQGRYVLEEVGPGPVSVQVKLAEFADAEEVAQVPAEGEAALDFILVPKATQVRATLRGLIRSKSGAPLKATVRVVELKLRIAVKADGRFFAEVPSGKYTVIIEARGYLTQTKSVEVSGGDQAIFHAELEKSR